MKKKIALDQIKPGARFSDDVFIDEKNLFVPAKIAVKQRDIDSLKRWGVASVVTEGRLINDSPTLDSASATEDSGSKQQGFAGSRELYLRYTDLVDRLSRIYEKIRTSEAVESKAVDQIALGILALAREERNAALSAILGSQNDGFDLAISGVNTAILSSVVGITLTLPPHKLSYLISGALLHDSGMLRIPESIVKKNSGLSEDEAQKMRAHPLLSYKIITKELLYPNEVGLVGLQHHERWDAEGYPRRTAGRDIDVLARIVSVADAFEAMVRTKPYRTSMIGYTAMKALLSDNSRRFDPDVIKAFIKSMGIYPLGSTVLLNNAAIGRVIEIHPEAPLRPRLRIIVDEFGKHYERDEGDAVDLVAEKTLFIARAIDPKELAGE
jgi:HD-GYP domain-containing protein (c-di-GMP phosphodiesterase class II)